MYTIENKNRAILVTWWEEDWKRWNETKWVRKRRKKWEKKHGKADEISWWCQKRKACMDVPDSIELWWLSTFFLSFYSIYYFMILRRWERNSEEMI